MCSFPHWTKGRYSVEFYLNAHQKWCGTPGVLGSFAIFQYFELQTAWLLVHFNFSIISVKNNVMVKIHVNLYLPSLVPYGLWIPSRSQHSQSCQINPWVNALMWTESFFEPHPAMNPSTIKVRWIVHTHNSECAGIQTCS